MQSGGAALEQGGDDRLGGYDEGAEGAFTADGVGRALPLGRSERVCAGNTQAAILATIAKVRAARDVVTKATKRSTAGDNVPGLDGIGKWFWHVLASFLAEPMTITIQ